MSTDNNEAAPISAEEQRQEARFAHTSRLSEVLAALGAHGSAVTSAATHHVTVTDHSQSGRMKYDSFNNVFTTADGREVSPQEMNERLAEIPIQRIPDDGRDTRAERARLAAALDHMQSRLRETVGFDNEGKPIYRLQGVEREQVERALKGGTEAFGYALDELDALDLQRKVDARAKTFVLEDDMERQARIETEAVAEAERILIRQRAEQIIAARKSSGGNW